MELWPLISIITAFAVFMTLRYKVLKARLDFIKEKDETELTEKAVENQIAHALTDMNASFEKNDGENEKLFTFLYQNARFIISYIRWKDNFIELVFPAIYHDKVDNIDIVRAFCNYMNSLNSRISTMYTTNNDDLYVNLCVAIPANYSAEKLRNEFTMLTAECFMQQREFIASINEQFKTAKTYDIQDLEFNTCCESKMKALLAESTLKLEESSKLPELRSYPGVTIGQLLDSLSLNEQCTLTDIEVHSGDYHFNSDDPQVCLNYPAVTPLLGHQPIENEAESFKNSDGFIRLNCVRTAEDNDTESESVFCLYLMLHAEHESKNALYYRLTYNAPQLDIVRSATTAMAQVGNNPVTGSVLLAYDLSSESQHKAEFSFMWDDMNDKIAENKTDELTPEQQAIYSVTRPSIAFYVYWGKRLMREERFLEAGIQLKRAWNAYNDVYLLKKGEIKKFHEISYLIGTCLYKLNRPEEALFFLNIPEDNENVNYYYMKLKCMIAANDPNTVSQMDYTLLQTEKQIRSFEENEDSVPVLLYELRTFLHRSKIELFINRRYLEPALKLCQEMLKAKEDMDFVLESLRTIKHLREQQSDSSAQKE